MLGIPISTEQLQSALTELDLLETVHIDHVTTAHWKSDMGISELLPVCLFQESHNWYKAEDGQRQTTPKRKKKSLMKI